MQNHGEVCVCVCVCKVFLGYFYICQTPAYIASEVTTLWRYINQFIIIIIITSLNVHHVDKNVDSTLFTISRSNYFIMRPKIDQRAVLMV